jgi:alpha-1,2-mannosyltransferase
VKLVLRLAVPLRFWCTYLLVGLAVGGMVAIAAVRPRRLVDLHYAFLPAARAVAAGHSPYVGAYSRLHAIGSAYVYPPPVAFATVPLTLMPEGAAAVLFVILSTAAVLASLWLLGVRTPAYFAAALVANGVWASEFSGTLSVFVLLAVAVAWRWRDRWVVVGAVVAAAVAAKIFCWPLVVWLVATRRFRAAALAMGASVAAVVVSWAAIGFADSTASQPC